MERILKETMPVLDQSVLLNMVEYLKGDLRKLNSLQTIYQKHHAILKNEIGRIRDIEIAADGSILILTDEDRGGIYRLYR